MRSGAANILLWTALVAVLCAGSGCAPSPHDCVIRGELDTLRGVLAKNPEAVGARDRKLKTPMHMAAGVDNVPAMEVLAAHGAVVDTKDITGMTPLHVAAMFGRRAAAEWLLDHGAAVNAVDAFGDTPLHTAAVFGRGHTVTLLAARGAALDARNHDGLTPRELALSRRHERVAALLERLEAGG